MRVVHEWPRVRGCVRQSEALPEADHVANDREGRVTALGQGHDLKVDVRAQFEPGSYEQVILGILRQENAALGASVLGDNP